MYINEKFLRNRFLIKLNTYYLIKFILNHQINIFIFINYNWGKRNRIKIKISWSSKRNYKSN